MSVFLQPMDERGFESHRERAIESFAKETAAAEKMPYTSCLYIARRAYAETLPDGPRTKNHFLFDVIETETRAPVGWLRFMLRSSETGSSVYIYDITIAAESRGKGYGKAVMRLAEFEAKKLGARSVKLHVFTHNDRARSLYDGLGFRVTGHMMCKEV